MPAGTAGRQISTGSGEGRKGTAGGCRSTGAGRSLRKRQGSIQGGWGVQLPGSPSHTPGVSAYPIIPDTSCKRVAQLVLTVLLQWLELASGGGVVTQRHRRPRINRLLTRTSFGVRTALPNIECHWMVPRRPTPIPTQGSSSTRDRFPKNRQLPPSDLSAVARTVPKSQIAGFALPKRLQTAWRRPAGSAPY